MRDIKNINDAQIVVKDLINRLEVLETKDIDLKKRRIKNCSPSVDDYDCIIRREYSAGIKDLTIITDELRNLINNLFQKLDALSKVVDGIDERVTTLEEA